MVLLVISPVIGYEPSRHDYRHLLHTRSSWYVKTEAQIVRFFQRFAFVMMAAGHIPAVLFAVLITSFCYGRLKLYAGGHLLYYIRNCLHAIRQFCWRRCAQKQVFWKTKPTTRDTVSSDFYFRHFGGLEVTRKLNRFHDNVIFRTSLVYGSTLMWPLSLMRKTPRLILTSSERPQRR